MTIGAREFPCVGCGCITRHSFDHSFTDRVGTVVWFRCDDCAMPRSVDVADESDVDPGAPYAHYELGGQG
jgi:hypothetical protein